jgi:hypothetical protein
MQEEINMKNDIEQFEELDNNLLIIKKLCEDIKARYEKVPMSWNIWEEDYKLNEEKGVAIENYNPSKTPFIHVLKELGLEGHNFGKHTFFSFKELFSFYPKIPEILLALEEHRTRLRKKIDEELSKIVKEERETTMQAIIQFARS